MLFALDRACEGYVKAFWVKITDLQEVLFFDSSLEQVRDAALEWANDDGWRVDLSDVQVRRAPEYDDALTRDENGLRKGRAWRTEFLIERVC